MNDSALAYKRVGNYHEAEKAYLVSIELYMKKTGGEVDNFEVLHALGNLHQCYVEVSSHMLA